MKIIHITDGYQPTGGIGSYLLRLCPAQQQAGHEVIVVHSDKGVIQSKAIRDYYVPGFAQFDNKGQQENEEKVMRILEKEQPEIVHIQANQNHFLEARVRSQFPTIKSLHVYDFCPSGNKFHNAGKKECHHATGPMCLPRMIYKRCTLSKRPAVLKRFYDQSLSVIRNDTHYPVILVASEDVRKKALATGYREDQVQVVPYFVKPVEEPEVRLSQEKIILFVGRIVSEKGLNLLIAAISRLKKLPNWKLVVNGDGLAASESMRLAHDLGVSERVQFRGWLNRAEHHECYQRATVVVVPSIWPEPFGLVGIEAMSYGKPVVAFKVGGIPDWLKDGETGYLIEPKNVDQMAEKIKLLLENPEQAKEMGEQGKIWAENEFSAQKHMERLAEYYDQVITTFKEKARLVH